MSEKDTDTDCSNLNRYLGGIVAFIFQIWLKSQVLFLVAD